MPIDYDPEREAEAAMALAVTTDGLDRLRWIRLAVAWHELARPLSPPGLSDDTGGIAPLSKR
jgi:hypothetical protein